MRPFVVCSVAAVLCAVPALPADDPPPTKKELADAQNRMKQIILAFHNYASTFNDVWPNNVYSKDKKPLLSWRVVILPYIEEERLFKEFKLDEPWDSEANKKLIPKMPKLYAPIRAKAKEGETFYRAFVNTGLFGPDRKYTTVGVIPDGTSNTGLVFEGGEPVVWTKPDDYAYDRAKPLPKLGGMFDGVCHVGAGDGAVYRIRKDPDEKELRHLIEPDDGELLDLDKLLVK